MAPIDHQNPPESTSTFPILICPAKIFTQYFTLKKKLFLEFRLIAKKLIAEFGCESCFSIYSNIPSLSKALIHGLARIWTIGVWVIYQVVVFLVACQTELFIFFQVHSIFWIIIFCKWHCQSSTGPYSNGRPELVEGICLFSIKKKSFCGYANQFFEVHLKSIRQMAV